MAIGLKEWRKLEADGLQLTGNWVECANGYLCMTVDREGHFGSVLFDKSEEAWIESDKQSGRQLSLFDYNAQQ